MSASRVRGALGFILASVGAWAACSGGLKLSEGNAFPCDYTVAEDARDAQCPEHWRCGIDASCHDARNEISLGEEPTYATSRRFPKVLTGAAKFVSGEPREQQLLVGYEDGSLYRTNGSSVQAFSVPGTVENAVLAGRYLLVKNTAAWTMYDFPSGPLPLPPVLPRLIREAGQPLSDIEGVRSLPVPPVGGPRVAISVLRPDNKAGEVEPVTADYKAFPPSFGVLSNGKLVACTGAGGLGCNGPTEFVAGVYADVRYVLAGQLGLGTTTPSPLASNEPVPVVLTPNHILVRTDGAGSWQVLNTEELTPSDVAGSATRGLLRHDFSGGLWAVRHTRQGKDILSTCVLTRSTLRLSKAWSDCAPCGSGRLVSFTPVSDGALGVEVLCKTAVNTLTLSRVVGSSVINSTDACLLQPLTPTVALEEVSGLPGAPVLDEAHGGGLVLGGKHGQLWSGPALSGLRPAFLDRAPVATELFSNGLMAFTPDYLAVDLSAGSAEGTGLTAMAPAPQAEGDSRTRVELGNLVQGSPSWMLMATGQLVRMERNGDALAMSPSYGPRLVGPRGEPVTGPYLGQGVKIDDNHFSLVLTANDQLYYTEVDRTKLGGDAPLGEVLSPKLTPEANFPILSLARDRTVSLGSESGSRVRGWVATGRSVFTFEQEAATKGWTLKQLSLGSSEPVELWTHELETASHGRVGLRDGQVLSLPDGLPITQVLPGKQRATDYAALNGWPIVLTPTGVYHAVKTQRADGKPGLLAWQPLDLPAAVTVGDLLGARVRVVKEPAGTMLYLFTNNGFVYQLGRN